MKLKLYTDKSFLPDGRKYVSLLFPFWGNPEIDPSDLEFGRFDDYVNKGRMLFEILQDPEICDFMLLPYEFSFHADDMRVSAAMDELAGKLGKKVLVFFNSDSNQVIPMKHAIIFRTSFFKSTQKSNEFALPGWSMDLQKIKGPLPLENKPAVPAISYCGYVDFLGLSERFSLDNIVKNLKRNAQSADKIGPAIRGKAVRKLMSDAGVDSNFIIRKGFWAPGIDKKKARIEYLENILGSGYALVARGAGNFSYRLLEVLSCGRIPVFINTDCVLPFDQLINWKEYVVWVEEKEMDRLPEVLKNFHHRLSREEYISRGRKCRELYEQWLSPLGFYTNLHKCLN